MELSGGGEAFQRISVLNRNGFIPGLDPAAFLEAVQRPADRDAGSAGKAAQIFVRTWDRAGWGFGRKLEQ